MIVNRFGYSVGLEFIRHLIDGGRLFFFSARHTAGTTAINYRVKTGANTAHVSFTLGAGAAATYDIIEDVTITGAGTAAVLRNYNRKKADDTLLTKLFNGTITYTGGTTFRSNQVGFGTNPGQAISGGSTGETGYQLKPNTEYILTMTPLSSVVTTIIMDIFETEI